MDLLGLIMDQDEAMTTVDVNTGGLLVFQWFATRFSKRILEAAVTIARQLRLKIWVGHIIVDLSIWIMMNTKGGIGRVQ